MYKKVRGFTLIEILVVIGIIALLAAVVIVAINPARQFAQARNSQRQSNIDSILNAIGQNLADNKGIFTCSGVTIATSPATSTLGGGGAGYTDLTNCLSPYLPTGMPLDPSVGSTTGIGYSISVDTQGRYQVCAPYSVETAIPGSTALCVKR